MPRPRLVPLCVAMLTVLALDTSPAQAAKFWKNSVVTGTWGTGTNWSATSAVGADNGGVPVGSEYVNIVSTDGTARTVTYNVSAPSLGALSVDLTGAGATTATLSIPGANSLTSSGLYVGGYNAIAATQTAGRGVLIQSAGTVTTNSNTDLILGHGANSTGAYTLSGGALVANQSELIGYSGTGTLTQNAGSNKINASAIGYLALGNNVNSTGAYNLSGTGTLSSASGEYIGLSGAGTFNQSGGNNTIAGGQFYVGYSASGTGNYTLSGGSLTTANASEFVGSGGTGYFYQSGGTNIIDNSSILVLGQDPNSAGAYYLSAGSLTVGFREDVGSYGTGSFYQTGGTNRVTGYFGLNIGVNIGSNGTYSITGNSSFSANRADIGGDANNSGGRGVLNVSDGGVFSATTLQVYNTPGSVVNLGSGGTINAALLNFHGVPALLNWTGGTLNFSNLIAVTFDSAADGATTSAAFGPALTLGADQTLKMYGNEGLGGTGAFSLTLNSGSTHNVGGMLTVNPTGTITQNVGSTLNAATIIQAGGTVNGTLQNQGNYVYQSGQFNGRLLNQGTVSLPASFTFPDGIENDANMTVAVGQTLTLNGAGLDNQGVFTLAGMLNVTNMTSSGHFIFDSGTLAITGAGGTNVGSIVSNTPNTTININANNVSLGNAASFTGFNHQGTLNVGANTITLNSAGFARLGIFTSLSGGTINAPNGVTFPSGSNCLGHGAVDARLTGESGAVIEADGALALGDAASPAGFSFGGELRTKQFAVTLNTSAIAGLGKLTTLGSGASAGTLNATNGLFVDFDGAITGFGTINSTNTLAKHATINGTVQGNSAGQPITLSGYIKGTGTFTNVSFTGTFSPGLSPTITSAGNLALASSSTLEMELGGITAGTSYDEIQATGALALGGTLHVSLINGFVPTAGQAFDILDWGTLSGIFSSINLPTLSGLTWNASQLYTTGVISVASAGLLGDYNNNGVVDAADYVVWRANQGTTNVLANDPIGGAVGAAQFNQWRAHFGQTAGSGSGATANAAVPEPTTLLPLTVAAAGWCLRRRRSASLVSKLIDT